ncbi:MAG: NUDIX domain-containing protein [Chitinivibrionales bacterium]|nr:NUDIX domain-containing protein [Chitinivibrionales bacterium]
MHVWIVNSRREILLQKRALTKESYPGFWDVSSAGHIEHGSTPLAAAVRETKEELGIAVKPEELQPLFASTQNSVQNNGAFIDNEFAEVYIVKKDFSLAEIIVDPKEVSEVKYVSFLEFKKMIEEKSADLVPHNDEYRRLINML